MAFSAYLIHLGILACMYVMLSMSLNLALGFTGMLNLGHVAFFGIGAYITAILSMAGLPLWLTFIIAFIGALLAGILLSLPTSRLRGDYLALATLGFTFIMAAIARNWQSVTRGALGIPGIPRLVASNELYFVWIGLSTVIIASLLFWLTRSRIGRTLQAIRDDELGAMVLGKNVFAYRMLALAVSAGIAGIAGFFFAHFITFVDPSVFSIDDLILMFSMVILGGLASLRGSVIASFIIFLLPEPLRFIGFPSSIVGPARAILFALILILMLIYKPRGLFGKVDLA